MQPRSHELVIRRAVAAAGVAPAERWLVPLLQGNADEDVHLVPLCGWRLRAAGLSHTYRPGRRFGELGAPSALSRCRALVKSAERLLAAQDVPSAWRALGRACHLLGDAAVPARTRGVWHFLGDPYERWVEDNLDLLAGLPVPALPADSEPGALVHALALLSSSHAADSTRTPWGRAVYLLGRGTVIDAAHAEAQARLLVPAAMAHTAALLRGFARRAETSHPTPPCAPSSS
jgi:hypothetical protein